MCKLTESNKSCDAEVDIEQEPELRPIWVAINVYGALGYVVLITENVSLASQ
jgi:hypothetical protein